MYLKKTMKIKTLSYFLLICLNYFTQKNCYLISGQGSDKRIFDSIQLPSNYEKIFLQYDTLQHYCSIPDLAEQLSAKIDTSKSYIFIGVSLGGMICVELSELLHREKTIIISSAKNRNELPFRYKFQNKFPLYAIFPSFMIKGGAKMLQPIVEPDRKKHKKIFKNMLDNKTANYYKKSVKMILKWERTSNTSEIIQIHGDNDHTLPIRKVNSVDYIISKGSHMMTLTRGSEINVIINEILSK